MGTALAVTARGRADAGDYRQVGLAVRSRLTWHMLLVLADDETKTYAEGWRRLADYTGQVSERTVMRAMADLVDRGLVTPLPRIPGEFRAYRLHP
jgi:DNA-binding PadR family transcriptional regulator